MSKTKQKLIDFLNSSTCLPDYKKKHYIYLIEKVELEDESAEALLKIFIKTEKKFQEIQTKNEKFKTETNKKYLAIVKKYFKNQKQKIFKEKEIKSRKQEDEALGNLLNKLEDV